MLKSSLTSVGMLGPGIGGRGIGGRGGSSGIDGGTLKSGPDIGGGKIGFDAAEEDEGLNFKALVG